MRFVENGPSIPDELLTARDQGRVVFFCGAGVSQAKAGLPDFLRLAETVTKKLGVSGDSPVLKLLAAAREIESQVGVSGLLTADRIFGLLEGDFLIRNIEAAVAYALKPADGLDLFAHETLLDLATTKEGKVRLVTTNFDRLFDECGRNLHSWLPPRLPEPARPSEMNGIVYLHGRVTADYTGAEGDGFVLSSSDFGRAYLSDGWATSFFRDIINHYVVIFVGYTADDSPVNYLLEALNKKKGKLENVYAFQAGNAENASSRWLHKGVKAIHYNELGGHRALWSTLEAWARRARDPDRWYAEIIDRARKGPKWFLPYERGQVAHIVSTVEGMRRFLQGDQPPPAEWLCVFDPRTRYGTPGFTGDFQNRGAYVDPFDFFCIDSDIPPRKIGPDDHDKNREIPLGSWDAFALNDFDRNNLKDDYFSSLRGHWASSISRLPSRLDEIGTWISNVGSQAAAVWWSARQQGLHPDITNRIRWQLERSSQIISPELYKAWCYLFEYWEQDKTVINRDWHELSAQAKKSGWNPLILRKYATFFRPHLKVEHKMRASSPIPPTETDEPNFHNLIKLGVSYPQQVSDFEIPDEWLVPVVAELRKNLEVALELEKETGGYGLSHISPITPDDDSSGEAYDLTRGLSGAVIKFSSLFTRLIQLNLDAAKHEFLRWPAGDNSIFARLRIWTARSSDIVSDAQFGTIVADISDETFWDHYHARDLLLTLASRWKALKAETRIEIGGRLLNGPLPREDEDDDSFEERRAWFAVSRITWLQRNGCEFHFDLTAETERLQLLIPEWKPEHADKVASSLVGRGGWVKTETEHSALLLEPLASVLSKARELSRRKNDSLIDNDPYAGLAAQRPVRAFAALRLIAKQEDFPDWAWRTFLNAEARKNDKPRFAAFVAEQLLRYSDETIARFIRPAANWFLSVSKVLSANYPATFDRGADALTRALVSEPEESTSAIMWGHEEPDWATESLNAPAGKLAQSFFNDLRNDNRQAGNGFSPSWLINVEGLLALPGNLRRHALVIFAHHLNWFWTIDREWSEKKLLFVLDSADRDDKNAFWGGFFWGARLNSQTLCLRLKPYLLELAKQSNATRHEHGQVLSGIILRSWCSYIVGTNERCIAGDELRDVLLHADDQFRSQLLWNAERWSSANDALGEIKSDSWLLELLREVWPRQKSVNSPAMSECLCDLAFSNKDRFAELAEIILLLVTPIDREHWVLPILQESKDEIPDLYPRQALALLYAVLPDNVSAWPYGIQDWLRHIAEADSTLKTDERFLELQLKWDSR